MSCAYKGIYPNAHRVYKVDCLMALYDVTRNTLSAWVKQGLRRSDSRQPYVFNGYAVKQFHKERRDRTKRQLRFGEFKCWHCKAATFPDLSTIVFQISGTQNSQVSACCYDCGKTVSKLHSEADCDKLRECLNTNTTLGPAGEETDQIPSGIGKDSENQREIIFTSNDRIIFEWMGYADRLDAKTVDAHLRSIREFEHFQGSKLFEKATKEDVIAFRKHLLMRVSADGKAKLSPSTVRHWMSHLKAYFIWLLKQSGSKKMDTTLPDYFALPRRFAETALPDEEKPALTIAQARNMLEAMPKTSMLQRRDRALFAMPFLGALRSDTTTSLRIKHFDITNKQIIQNAAESRTKNGKSFKIDWFPVPPLFSETICEWLEELKAKGFREEDALFPSEHDLKKSPLEGDPRISSMKSTSTVEMAFKKASRLIGEKFNPHSAKHCIGLLMYDFCVTAKERKAWSMNMGHEKEVVTETYYRKVPAPERRKIFDGFLSVRTDRPDDMELMLQYHDHELTKGTPEFMRAEMLVLERRKRRNAVNDDVIELCGD